MTDDYNDSLIAHIRSTSSFQLPPYLDSSPDRPYTEPWRRRAFQVTIGLVRAWDAAKVEGVAQGFTRGAKTEEDYADGVERLLTWWEGKQVMENGLSTD